MALSQLFWDVLMPRNLKSTYFSLKMIHFLSLNIWYVIYVVFWIKYWNLKLPHHCILFLFTICTVSQLFWNRVCKWLPLWMGLWIIDSHDLFKTRLHSELNTAQQFCCVFIGNIFIGKIEQKHRILCLKYINYLFTIKSHLHLIQSMICTRVLRDKNSTHVIGYCSRCWCDIAYHMI